MSDPLDVELEELRKRAERLMPKYAETTFKGFLEETPPDTRVYLTDLKRDANGHVEIPDIVFPCDNQVCAGPRIFRCATTVYASPGWKNEFLRYTCRNCGSNLVKFAIDLYLPKTETSTSRVTCLKLGQIPAFGPQIPARVITLIGPDRDVFLQGLRAESRGMGIGAFAYYRRVVENQKNRIIAEIAKVARLLGAPAETNDIFAVAIKETQFSKSVAMVKDAIPQSLMIRGQNPLTLLHSALSKGLHDADMTDEHCLRLAQSIRTILVDLSERASEALKDNKEIQSALSVLIAAPDGPKTTSQ
jgi:hypothetical protein